MLDLENAEEILQILERYTKQKSKAIPEELNGYLSHVALTGDSVYSWSKVRYFFREKLSHVIKDFHDTTPRTEDLPVSRNVDAFNYDTLKTTLLERFDLFNAAPFTIQRLSELLNEPKKHYSRLDKFMRALEKNILVVSTVEPGQRQMGSENGDSINGDPLMDINVDVDMEKEPSSSCVSTTEQKSIEAQLDASAEEQKTENKTEKAISEHGSEETTKEIDKVSTNGHHNSDEKIGEDSQINEKRNVESDEVDKTENESVAVETITVEVQPIVLGDKDNLTEVAAGISDPNPDNNAELNKSDVEQSSEIVADVTESVDEKKHSENDDKINSLSEKDSNAIVVEKTQRNDAESVKLSRQRDVDVDVEDYQPSSAKIPKLEEPGVVEEKVVSTVKEDEDIAVELAVKDVVSEVCTTSESSEEKEAVPDPVLQETSELAPIVIETETVTIEEQLNVSENAAIETSDEDAQIHTTDETKSDAGSGDSTISPLASTLSNDLDILEEEEDELIADVTTEQNILEPVTLAEADVEMLPLKSIDNLEEQMAVEDPATTSLPSVNSDSAMDATQIIPSTDEQMDVFETNQMADQMDL